MSFEAYNLWKRNVSRLYDVVVEHTLGYPSPTVEWLPSLTYPHKLLLGGNGGRGKDVLIVAEVQLHPCRDMQMVKLARQIVLPAGLRRARCMPQNPDIVAIKSSRMAPVCIYDVSKKASSAPQQLLYGHCKSGCALSWSPKMTGFLLSGSADQRICLWDVAASAQKFLHPTQVFQHRDSTVHAVAWHNKHDHVFGSGDKDGKLMIWDLRISGGRLTCVDAHKEGLTCLAFNPVNEWLVATGSMDSTIAVFDLRKLSNRVVTLSFHKDPVLHLSWKPYSGTVIASSGKDKRLMIWDIGRYRLEDYPDEEAPPELMFIHGGHTEMIPDFSWHPTMEWRIASVAGDNMLHIWEMGQHIYTKDRICSSITSQHMLHSAANGFHYRPSRCPSFEKFQSCGEPMFVRIPRKSEVEDCKTKTSRRVY